MLDIKFVRENKEKVKENIKKKFQDEKLPLVDEVVELDEKVRVYKNKIEIKFKDADDLNRILEIMNVEK